MKNFFFNITLVMLLVSVAISVSVDDWFKQHGVDYYETPAPGKFLLQWMKQKTLTKNTVILLDLDDTVFSTPADNWVRPDVYYNIREEQIKKYPNLTTKEVEHRIKPLLLRVFTSLPYLLTDKQLPKAINTLKAKGFTVLALTAREKRIIPNTLQWLKRLKVNFSRKLADDEIAIKKNNLPIIIKEGVIFVGPASKGDALNLLLNSGKLGKPETILFIDDRINHLKTTTTAVVSRKQNITFIPVLCTYPKITFKPYEAKQAARILLRFVYDNCEKKEIKALLDSDPYTDEIVTQQCVKQLDLISLPLCKALKIKYCTQQNKENSSLCKSMVAVTQ